VGFEIFTSSIMKVVPIDENFIAVTSPDYFPLLYVRIIRT